MMNVGLVQELYFKGIKLVLMVSDLEQNQQIVYQFDKHRYIFLIDQGETMMMVHGRRGSPRAVFTVSSAEEIVETYKQLTDDGDYYHYDDNGNLVE